MFLHLFNYRLNSFFSICIIFKCWNRINLMLVIHWGILIVGVIASICLPNLNSPRAISLNCWNGLCWFFSYLFADISSILHLACFLLFFFLFFLILHLCKPWRYVAFLFDRFDSIFLCETWSLFGLFFRPNLKWLGSNLTLGICISSPEWRFWVKIRFWVDNFLLRLGSRLLMFRLGFSLKLRFSSSSIWSLI